MTEHPLIGEVCTYDDWLQRGTALHADFTFVFIPSLLSNVIALETELHRPASEAEVIDIRNRSSGLAIPNDQLNGYTDLDPQHCWQQWCLYKSEARDV
ncbi:MAG: hypothetical protein ACOY3E_01190 [Pseudomonadota bacterium]